MRQDLRKTYGLVKTKTSFSCRKPNCIPLLTSSFFRVSPNPSASPTAHQYMLKSRSCTLRTTAQTENFNMVSKLRIRKSLHRWRKKHSFVIRMRDQQTYLLVTKLGKFGVNDCDTVLPCSESDDRDGKEIGPLHFGHFKGVYGEPLMEIQSVR